MNLMRNKLRFIRIAGYFAIAFLVWSCAAVVAPSGGPKDTRPPALVSVTPESNSVNFNSKNIIITFDEYVSLKNLEKELIISPPLNKDPLILEKGKSIAVKLKDSLRSNTTYSIYFGNSIVDYTEGNPFPNFNYAFSTGPQIDSLTVTGTVIDAFTSLPAEEAVAVLYYDFDDSLPRKTRPVYVSRTNKKGEFTIRNIAARKYRLLAFKDNNSDYMYNLPNELVAFSSDSVTPYFISQTKDSTISFKTDSAFKAYELRLFSEPDSTQRVSKGMVVSPGKLLFTFRYPTHNASVLPVDTGMNIHLISQYSANKDTLTVWVKQPVPDSLHLVISDNNTILDTIDIATIPREKAGSKKDNIKATIQLKSNLESGTKLNLNDKFRLNSGNPLAADTSFNVDIIRKNAADTVKAIFKTGDSLRTTITTDYKWETGEEYTFKLPGGILHDIYSLTNDTLNFKLQVIPKEDYGSMKIKVLNLNAGCPVILQLLGGKDIVIRQMTIPANGIVNFGLLKPAKYGARVIFDENGNGRWDTGSLKQLRQPEKVIYFSKTLENKAGWELEEDWDLFSVKQ